MPPVLLTLALVTGLLTRIIMCVCPEFVFKAPGFGPLRGYSEPACAKTAVYPDPPVVPPGHPETERERALLGTMSITGWSEA